MSVSVQLAQPVQVECRELSGEERLGAPTRLELLITSPEPLVASAVLGAPCAVVLETRHGTRPIAGVVTRLAAIATARPGPARAYRLSVASRLEVLELRKRSRVYQKLTAPQIVRKVLEEGGYPASSIEERLGDDHAAREYVVQYAESDAAFVRRMCEDDGLYFHFGVNEDGEVLVLADRSSSAAPALGEGAPPLALIDHDQPDALGSGLFAFGWRSVSRRRAGKVTLRDYDHENPGLALEGVEAAGTPVEQGVEVYDAPGGFRDAGAGAARARLRLESLRADARTSVFQTTAVALAPGLSFSVKPHARFTGAPPIAEEHVVTAVRHRWTAESVRHSIEVEAIPRDVPFRLPRVTPRPVIHGLQSAFVTGADGEEIHPDHLGRIFVRFPWDLDGPRDDKSSLPVRVSQPNMPGSMVIPRVGWEVLVAFEDGDPDRPYVIGRTYNGKMRPPFSLPENKTITSLATDSSPGGAKRTSIHFDDAAGREHVKIQAAFAKRTEVGGKMLTQTVKNERISVTADRTRKVSGDEDVSVTQAHFANVGSLAETIGAAHTLYVTGNMMIGVRTASAFVGAAQIEKVGNPVKGAINLGVNAALAVVGGRGTAGAVLAAAGGLTKAGIEGYMQGGRDGALRAVGMGALGIGASLVPGGEAVLASITGTSHPMPWDHGNPTSGSAEPGGGAGGGASDASAARGPGPGYRRILVKGAMVEIVGGAFCVVTPGTIGWTNTGGSAVVMGGSHTIKAPRVSFMTLGASVESLGSLNIQSKGKISRDVTGLFKMDVDGALTTNTSEQHTIRAPSVTLKVDGALTLDGAHVTFQCGGAKVSSSPGGLLIEAGQIEITGECEQSGSLTHT